MSKKKPETFSTADEEFEEGKVAMPTRKEDTTTSSTQESSSQATQQTGQQTSRTSYSKSYQYRDQGGYYNRGRDQQSSRGRSQFQSEFRSSQGGWDESQKKFVYTPRAPMPRHGSMSSGTTVHTFQSQSHTGRPPFQPRSQTYQPKTKVILFGMQEIWSHRRKLSI